MKLMTREMIDHRLPKSLFMEKMVEPTTNALRQALLRVCPQLDPAKTTMCIFSLIGQLIHLVQLKEMFEKDEKMNVLMYDFEQAINHIVEFSAAGIRASFREKNDV